ncbi:Qat anti-phage system TatD family nuclease QatD [Wenyingzhuangia aestuarii]|uniref:Qat anti-phage system TatD family nuclease QatD n=1 Tax=Wenyingzhuangia aestuarii TaxID=1647582 RepID=UPI00143ABA84|nr:Qat anti-phage system TatD family nuclease QatD [Wenyingzhuangia aestuarii]NJB83589.1 TatD DNase family protein [Wenyingzhuangia aestuarii]
MIIDTHCHVDLYPNPKSLINDLERDGILTIGMTNLPSHFKMGYPHVKNLKKIRLALGLHPLLASNHFQELPLFMKYLDYTSYIGEVGLDFSKDGINTKNIQLDSFEKILQVVSSKQKILSIHSRKAEKEVLMMLRKHKIKNAIFHWYTGGLKLIDEIVESGYYFSINTSMIKSINGQKIISRIPKEKILTETDGPFVKYNGRIVKSNDISVIIEYLNIQYNSKMMEGQIYENFKKLLDRISDK